MMGVKTERFVLDSLVLPSTWSFKAETTSLPVLVREKEDMARVDFYETSVELSRCLDIMKRGYRSSGKKKLILQCPRLGNC